MAFGIERFIEQGARTALQDGLFGRFVERLMDVRPQATRGIDPAHLNPVLAGDGLAQATPDTQAVFNDLLKGRRVFHKRPPSTAQDISSGARWPR